MERRNLKVLKLFELVVQIQDASPSDLWQWLKSSGLVNCD